MIALAFAKPGETLLLAEKILAVLGGAGVGALLVGLLTQLLTRACTMQKMPRWAVNTMRVVGGILGGWVVALWVLGGGGAGFGGLGGWGLGSGKGDGATPPTNTAKPERENKLNEHSVESPTDETLRIEVLGGDDKQRRWYRLGGADGARLSLAEVKEAVKRRQEKEPPLRRLEIVLYKDSPEEHLPIVRDLQTWGRELNDGKMKVDVRKPDADAPRK